MWGSQSWLQPAFSRRMPGRALLFPASAHPRTTIKQAPTPPPFNPHHLTPGIPGAKLPHTRMSVQADLRFAARTVKEMGLDDLQKFLPIEEHATLEMMLMSRSAIYQPAAQTAASDACPQRGS